ncbi:xanthine dehydrogenase family protein subunit M [Ramlibacter solisilvae]|uniref:FAD-binding PCMH-type domain-containing protein n=1 Tax=Ramlibacter tataouinensis TaxID=94132 RepID=A0A127JRA3_9BURK|nr:FAD binding domain-containing protein [Ramlibacter tataouinensis]AMO22510.1 hypothetical protein UC35_05925 [Ramlibacter tataouinensis]
MRSLPLLDYLRAADVAGAVALAARGGPGSRFVAGGTDLLPNLRRGLLPTGQLIDIGTLAELRGIAVVEDGTLVLGTGLTLGELAASPVVAERLPALAQAARSVGGPAHRAAGTLGGNLCQDTRCIFYNQGEWWRAANDHCLKFRGERCHVAPQGQRCHAAFCSDLAPVLLAARAQVRVAGAGGTRTMALAELYRDDGAAHLTLAPGEIVARVLVPPVPGPVAFDKLRQRGGIDFALASVAVLSAPGGVRIALSATGSCPQVFELGEGRCDDAAVRSAVLKHASCMRTTSTPATYRREAAAALALKLLAQARASEGSA